MKNIWNYSQPSFYKFNQDSIELTKFIISNTDKNFKRALDLCCGCGVIGIELLSKNKIESCDFLELQEEFLIHILKNLEQLELNYINYSIYLGSINTFFENNLDKFHHKYDLIVANPPYFSPEKNRVSENNLTRNYCRFFLKDNYELLFKFVLNTLKNDGTFCFLSRNDLNYFLNLNIVKEYSNLKINKVVDLEGASIFIMHIL